MKYLIGSIRLIGMALIIAAYLVPIMGGVLLFHKDLRWTIRMRQHIARALMWWLQVKIKMTGQPRDGNFLFISNHRSYLDPAVMACYVAFLPVAKAEVYKWPLIGFGVKVTGILFVKREDKTSRSDTRAGIREALRNGLPVLIYPEGTTTNNRQTLPFRTGTFQIAAEANIPVIPVAISYGKAADAWLGDDQFVPHFISCFGKWHTDAYIHFGEPISSNDPAVLVQKTQQAIDEQLSLHNNLP